MEERKSTQDKGKNMGDGGGDDSAQQAVDMDVDVDVDVDDEDNGGGSGSGSGSGRGNGYAAVHGLLGTKTWWSNSILDALDLGELQDSASYLVVTATRLTARFECEIGKEGEGEDVEGSMWREKWMAESSPLGITWRNLSP